MTNQDANIPISIIDGDNKSAGLLKIQHNNGNVTLSFYREQETDPNTKSRTMKKYSQIPDKVCQLSDFTKIEISSNDKYLLTLSGSRSKFQIHFNNEDGFVNFFEYVGQKIHLKHSDCNPRVFLLESHDSTDQSIPPYMATVLPMPKGNQKGTPSRISKNTIQEINQKIIFEYSKPIKTMTKSEFETYLNEDGKIKENTDFPSCLFNVDLEPSIASEIWKVLLSDKNLTKAMRDEQDKENLEKYKNLKRQWTLTTKKQWENHRELRRIVSLLENDIKENSDIFENYQNKHNVQQIVFNIFLTLSYYHWDQASYLKGMVRLIGPFLLSFVEEASEDGVKVTSGAVKSEDEVESEMFWAFVRFYERNNLAGMLRAAKKPVTKEIFNGVGAALEANWEPLLELLLQRQVYTLDFMRDDLSGWFSGVFSPVDLRRLWISELAVGEPQRFFIGFVSAILFALAPRFVDMNPLNSEEFVRKFGLLKREVDMGVLLENTRVLLSELSK